MDDMNIQIPYECYNIEVGIVKVVNVRIIARIDNDPSILNNVISNFLSRIKNKDFDSKVIVETFNEDYDYTLTIFRDDDKRVYITELEKRTYKSFEQEKIK